MRRTSTALLAILALLLLSGCFKVEMDLEVNADETVDGTMIVALDEEMYAMLSADDDSSMFGTEDMPEGAEVEPYEADGLKGQKVTFTDVPLTEFAQSLEEGDGEFSLRHEGDEYVFEASMSPDDMAIGSDSSSTGELDQSMDEAAQRMLEEAEFKIAITFPGDIVESNGTEKGNTVSWDVDLTEETQMRAVAADEDSGRWIVPVALGAIVLLMLGVGGWLLLRRRLVDREQPGAE